MCFTNTPVSGVYYCRVTNDAFFLTSHTVKSKTDSRTALLLLPYMDSSVLVRVEVDVVIYKR